MAEWWPLVEWLGKMFVAGVVLAGIFIVVALLEHWDW